MSSLMTLREALALIDDVRADRSYCAAAGKHFAPPADLARARAIVGAAVEAHEARCKSMEEGVPMHEAADRDQFEYECFRDVRALERGEGSEVQP